MPRKTSKIKYSRPYRKRKQCGGFLNRYGFAYAGRDVANQLGKIAHGVIKDVSSQINDIAQQRINQAIIDGAKELEKIVPKILRGAIKDHSDTKRHSGY